MRHLLSKKTTKLNIESQSSSYHPAPWLLVDIETMSLSTWCCRRGLQYLLIECGLLFAAFLIFFLMTLPQVLFIHARTTTDSDRTVGYNSNSNSTDTFVLQCLLLNYTIEIDDVTNNRTLAFSAPTIHQTSSIPNNISDSPPAANDDVIYQQGRPILQVACPTNITGGRVIMKTSFTTWSHAVAYRSMDPKETWSIAELNIWFQSHVPQEFGKYVTLYYNPSYSPYLTTSIDYTLKARVGMAFTAIFLLVTFVHASVAVADFVNTRRSVNAYRQQIQCGMIV